MERSAMHTAACGSTQHQWRRGIPAIVRFGHHVYDLVEGAADKIDELKFGDRTHAGKGRAKGGAHNCGFGDRSINHPLWTKAVDESIGHFERAAIDADVFTNTEDGGIG